MSLLMMGSLLRGGLLAVVGGLGALPFAFQELVKPNHWLLLLLLLLQSLLLKLLSHQFLLLELSAELRT